METADKKANDCALQHIKVFRQQALKEAIADFGEPFYVLGSGGSLQL